MFVTCPDLKVVRGVSLPALNAELGSGPERPDHGIDPHQILASEPRPLCPRILKKLCYLLFHPKETLSRNKKGLVEMGGGC